MRFEPDNGNKPTQKTVKTGTLAAPPQHNPQRDGFLFNGWTYDGQPFDFRTPILQDTTLKAKWTKATDWTLSPDHGPASGTRLTISPPERQEPQFASIQTSGDQIVGLTGDGRIYTWTQDSPPKQVSSPAQTPDGFHYLQAAAGSQWQAALGSDQHIYTWTSQQATPTTLKTSQNTQLTSISVNENRLLAVDQQGQVYAYQTSQADGNDPNPKPEEQAVSCLPGQAQAVFAVASASRILALDTDGQAWTWDATNTRSTQPEHIRQNPGTRIIQTAALNKGFLILDSQGQVRYLAGSTVGMTPVILPSGVLASRITADKNQAMITGKDGRLWAWQPGSKPIRADNGNQQYTQAVSTASRIIAINRQGGIYTWSLDAQGRPGKANRTDTTTVPILESASIDGQALTLHKTNDAWQAQTPARKPGQAIIVITGRQNNQTFTRNLNYTVDQTLTRDTRSASTHTVTFDTDKGSPTPGPQQVDYPYGRIQRPALDPTREGYRFDGWFINNVAYDFSKPVTNNLTLTAKWTRLDSTNTWKINPDKGSQLGRQQTTITPSPGRGIRFSQISGSKNYFYGFSLAVGSDGNAYAWGDNTYGELGDGSTTERHMPAVVKTPDRKTYPDLPPDFTYVQVSAGGWHSLALGSDGYVYAWGWDFYGQLGNNTSGYSVYSYVPVRVRDPNNPTDASKGLKAVQVSAGASHSLALGSDGCVYSWGNNPYGQLGNNTTTDSSFPVPVRDPKSPTDAIKRLKALQISAGASHSLAVGSDGYAYAWGYNANGQLGNNTSGDSANSPVPARVRDPATPTDTSRGLKATQVSGGYAHSLAAGSDGNAYAWGYNGIGQLGNSTKKDSSFPMPVRDPSSPYDSSKGLKATQVSGGENHSLAVDQDGNAWAWGDNDHGQLGIKSTKDQSFPVKVFTSAQSTSTAGPWLHVAQLIAGDHHSLAIDTDGNTKAWGINDSGRLGDGTIKESNVPVPVAFNLQPVISAVRFDTSPATSLNQASNSNSVTVVTPAHEPGPVTVSVDYTLGGTGQILTDKSLTYTYTPLGVLPKAGGEGILLALATGMTGMGGVLASRRHRKETHRLLHASHE